MDIGHFFIDLDWFGDFDLEDVVVGAAKDGRFARGRVCAGGGAM